jgi:hypothetical protein
MDYHVDKGTVFLWRRFQNRSISRGPKAIMINTKIMNTGSKHAAMTLA